MEYSIFNILRHGLLPRPVDLRVLDVRQQTLDSGASESPDFSMLQILSPSNDKPNVETEGK